jgi:DMSO/TMAO reductase YedYZ molybdopterin-dependent catalytic subunit
MIGRRAVLQAAGTLALLRSRIAWADGAADAGGALDEVLVRQGATPQNLSTPIAYFDRLITPTPVFFVRSHFGPPALDKARKTTIDGMVKTPLTLSVDELRAQFPEVTVTALLQCAGNGRSYQRPTVPGVQWNHGAMGQATFTGVRLKDVLTKAGIAKEALHVRMAGADAPPKPTVPAFIRSIPIERAMDPTTLLAYRMNGEDLTLAHGAPLRLVVPAWAGDHWVKWLVSVRPQKEEADGFFMKTAYRMPIDPVEPGAAVPPEKMKPASTFPVKSIIARPGGGKQPLGPQEVVGLAFSGNAPIASVEVSIDGGKTFAPAKVEGEPGIGRAQVFRFRFDQKTPGHVRAVVRAKDKKGGEQSETPTWNPSGYFWNGWHAAEWEVGS